MEKEAVLIGSTWEKGKGTQLITSSDPVYSTLLWQGHAASEEQVNKAVASAQNAFLSWSNHTLQRRIAVLENFRTILEKEKSAFSKVISQETGKPLWEARNEIDSMIGKVAISLDAYTVRTGEHQEHINNITLMVRHKPLGVMGVLGPYNFPGHLPNGHIIPALLAGNTIVFKPSELTPLTAEYTLRYWQQAGLPAGVINLVIGGADTGKALIANTAVKGVLFTGSYPTGKLIHESLAGQPERLVALEMGGNNALIVSDIKDIDAAVLITLLSAYLTSGQRCTCARRLIVVENDHSIDFLNRLATAVHKIPVAAYDADPHPFMSSVITPAVAEKLLITQQKMIDDGAQALAKMHLLTPSTGLLTPGLIDVTSLSQREDKEIFGPLLQVIRVSDFNEALLEANNTAYGLAAGLLSDKIEHFQKFYTAINAGIINWNRPTTGSSSSAPFGGVGRSGNYRPSALYAADYCAYPVASMETARLELPAALPKGLENIF